MIITVQYSVSLLVFYGSIEKGTSLFQCISGFQRMDHSKKLTFSLKKTASELYLPVLS